MSTLTSSGVNFGGGSTLAPSGSAPSYACRAWVNFNGTGTVAINGSGNVSSITDNGTGRFSVNFISAMPDANYSVGSSGAKSNDPNFTCAAVGYASGYVLIGTGYPGFNNAEDLPYTNVNIFR